MKILTWNCNGAFRKKIRNIDVSKIDILIIQECENPDMVKFEDDFYNAFEHRLWVGDTKNKGLGVYSRNRIKKIDIDNKHHGRKLKHFIAFADHNEQKYLAAWTHKNDCAAFQYIGQLYLLMEKNQEFIKNSIILGDLNSNTIWDEWDRWWNHSDIVKILTVYGIKSVYHVMNNEEQGKESQPTFFHRKDLLKSYHIDYIFSPQKLIENTRDFKIIKEDNLTEMSDHLALEWEYNELEET
ncbi:endonuclease/exonuclease/phosphatase family protein [Spirochaeta lutea]|nr:endonuclease/exonuclease/phosphatase family protein [Spirochaeta lutea]